MMKFLLTSAGITNQTIADEAERLVEKPLTDASIVVVATAAMAEPGDKSWYLRQFDDLRAHGARDIDIVDIAVADIDWRRRMAGADIVYVSGGNTFYLLDHVRRAGFDVWLQDRADSTLYVGVSAGSIIMGQTIDVATIAPADENFNGLTDLTALGWLAGEIEPHCDGARFALIRDWAASCGRTVYALNDASAVSYDGQKVQMVGGERSEIFDFVAK